MKKNIINVFAVICTMFIAGCATTSYYRGKTEKGYIDLKRLQHDYNFTLKATPFSDKFILENKIQRLIIKDRFNYVLVNGKPCYLKQEVIYRNGNLFVPSSILGYLKKFRREKISGAGVIPIEIKTVVIDPGHGGRDPGAISPWGLREKEVNLSIAKFLYHALKNKGIKVYLTRYSDYFVSLKQRVVFARKKNADLFISIHANSCPSKNIRGLSVYYLADRFTNRQARILATAENMCQRKGISFSSDIKKIIGELINTENKRETSEIADIVLRQARRFGISTRGKIGAPFYVLKYNLCPAILVETGYLTNRQEERMLRSKLYRQQIANVLAAAVLQLKEFYSGRRLVKYEK